MSLLRSAIACCVEHAQPQLVSQVQQRRHHQQHRIEQHSTIGRAAAPVRCCCCLVLVCAFLLCHIGQAFALLVIFIAMFRVCVTHYFPATTLARV
jgi:hypothetical protein